MKSYPLLSTLFAKNNQEFISGLTELFISRGFSKFTIWQITNGVICRPLNSVEGLTGGTFDTYDLGYDGNISFVKDSKIEFNGEIFPVYAGCFCGNEGRLVLAVTFHEPVGSESEVWLQALMPFIGVHAEELFSGEERLEIYVDYQKKIDFIIGAGEMLRLVSTKEVIVNTLNYFAEIFNSQVSCCIYGNFFEGIGINEADLKENIYYGSESIYEFISKNHDTIFLETNIESGKFKPSNIFIVYEKLSNACFILFNVNVIPDTEFSSLITNIAGVAIENAKHHERMTKFQIEEAEMSQTIEILNQFVLKEQQTFSKPQIYSVNHPAKSTGGDYTTIKDTEDFTFVCVADVCGKGYAAAVFTVMLATLMDSGLYTELEDLERLVNGLNKYLLKHDFNDRFITGFFCYYDKATRELSYISCGHEPALLLGNSDHLSLISENVPLGITNESYTKKKVSVKTGDLLFVYTDGVTEYISLESLIRGLKQVKNTSPRQIVETLYNDLVTNPAEQRDDFTCVAVKF